MKFGADNLPDDPVLLKALILQLQEENALLRHKLFSPKSERSPEDADSPQLAMFNEVEELIEAPAAEPVEAEEVVAPVKRRGKRKPLPANLPRMEVIHELPEHELTCACGACKQSICSIGTLSLPSRAHPNRPSVSVAVGQFGWARVQILAGELNTGCALRSGS
ncbi:transposase IS66 [Ectopseudomonas oleovorans]|uniref:Transposase IS66 n=2 Tax=Ectopseudomonas oleovorans TaxID=301 RepID=A0A061CUV2_ECTOL|nr:transposase IS66 [Pseudomonas oleovorans CECT 5344]CDR92426.1 transposase IS66 [Pseudomonas oleovorans]SUD52346.1 transposase IS66 [Pseudomonas oleovorans]SUD61370.1 transposase IS66 [Pseudomonas oleovorans]